VNAFQQVTLLALREEGTHLPTAAHEFAHTILDMPTVNAPGRHTTRPGPAQTAFQAAHAADAEAICEAVTRPTMRFVPVKSAEQQSVLVLHRTRDLLIRQRIMLANSLGAHCAEFGLVVAQGMAKLAELLAQIADHADTRIPPLAGGPRIRSGYALGLAQGSDCLPRVPAS
jgi:hypothetical protein